MAPIARAQEEKLYKYNRRLWCSVLQGAGRGGFDLDDGHGIRLYVAPGECPDMGATIRTALKVDPEVQRITVYSGLVRDLLYVRGDDGRWAAHQLIYDRTPQANHPTNLSNNEGNE
jgi:hypothetical protein